MKGESWVSGRITKTEVIEGRFEYYSCASNEYNTEVVMLYRDLQDSRYNYRFYRKSGNSMVNLADPTIIYHLKSSAFTDLYNKLNG
jgi:hypothetical protein